MSIKYHIIMDNNNGRNVFRNCIIDEIKATISNAEFKYKNVNIQIKI